MTEGARGAKAPIDIPLPERGVVLEQLLEALTPDVVDAASGSFAAAQLHPRAARVYGGQVLAQCLRAAAETVPHGRVGHSQHAYFLRPGDPAQPLQLLVERTRDGASFSARRVQALQRGKPILNCSLSFQTPEEGAGAWQASQRDCPGPDGLRSERERALAEGWFDPNFAITTGLDLDVRCVEPLVPKVDGSPLARARIWVKTRQSLIEDLSLHQALVAYVSDAFLLDICLCSAGLDWRNPALQCASLDHALWFHGPMRADSWLLHEVEAEWLGGGRALARGRFYAEGGRLVASCTQEGLIRLRQTSAG